MNFKKIVRNWLFGQPVSNGIKEDTLSCDGNELEMENATRIYIFPAIGGRVIEFRRYDHDKDRRYHARYIIKDSDDFGTAISRCCTLENLKY